MRRLFTRVTPLVGIALVLAALAIPSAGLVGMLRAPQPDPQPRLELGATLFRVALLLLGLAVIALPSLLARVSEAGARTSPAPAPSRFEIRAVGVILLVAALLRLYRLDTGLWYDEILTYLSYVKMPFGEIVTTYDSENQHFLFSILAHGSYLVFGDTSWAVRLPAALFGIASVGALFLLGRQIASTREALLGTALLAVSYHHIWFSQSARGYTGLLFWTILSSWLFLRAVRERRLELWLWYGLTAALGIYTHLTMLFAIAGQGLIYLGTFLARRSQTRRQWLLQGVAGFGSAGLFTFVLFALVLPQMLFGNSVNEVSLVPAWKNPLWTLLEFARGLQIGFAGGLIGALALLVFAIGLASYTRSAPSIVLLLALPALICAALVVGLGHHLWPRFFFFLIGFGVLIAVRGAIRLGDMLARLPLVRPTLGARLGTAFAAGLILASTLSVPFAYRPKQDFEGALAFIQSSRQPGDKVAVAGLAAMPYQEFFRLDWQEVDSLETLDAIQASAQRTWFVYTLPVHLQAVHPDVFAKVQQDFELMKRFDGSVGDGAVYVYRANGRPAAQSATHAGAAWAAPSGSGCRSLAEASAACPQ